MLLLMDPTPTELRMIVILVCLFVLFVQMMRFYGPVLLLKKIEDIPTILIHPLFVTFVFCN